MFSACKKSAIALLLGIIGLCAAPVEAQKPLRLLFLGISKDGRTQQQAERAVQLRLEGLGVSVIRPKAMPVPPCERADCLASAMASEGAELALTARILRNEHACLATLFLMANKAVKPIEQDIACRSDAMESELVASLADGAAGMVEVYYRNSEPVPALSVSTNLLNTHTEHDIYHTQKYHWSKKRKALVSILGVFLAGGIAATISFTSIDLNITPCIDQAPTCINIMSFRSASTAVGVVSGAIAASLVFLTIKL